MSIQPIGLSGVLQLRAEILQKSQSLGAVSAPAAAKPDASEYV